MTSSTESASVASLERSGSPKTHRGGTSHRALPPEVTWKNIKPHFAALGISRVAVITGLDVVGIPVVTVTRPNARSLSVSQGKGIDLMSAKVSGAMESIEQHCAEHLDLPLRYTSYRELVRQARVLSPGLLPCIPSADLETRPALYVEGVRLSDAAPCWLPHGLVHLDMRRPLAPGADMFPLSSNGLASGNTRSEALVHGLLEVIERDAWARFMDLDEDARARRRLDLGGVPDGSARQLLTTLQNAGLNVVVWDLSGELGVACFLCQLVDEEADWAFQTGRAEGLGCHTDGAVALSRALCEAAQSRLCAIAGSRDDMTRASTARIRAPLSIERAQRELRRQTPSGVAFGSIPMRYFDSFDAELEWLSAALLRAFGAEAFAVDIPAAGVPVHVVRVIAAGLVPPHFLSKQAPRSSFTREARS
jgi:YcaO-like protein with predicted kinase domain